MRTCDACSVLKVPRFVLGCLRWLLCWTLSPIHWGHLFTFVLIWSGNFHSCTSLLLHLNELEWIFFPLNVLKICFM